MGALVDVIEFALIFVWVSTIYLVFKVRDEKRINKNIRQIYNKIVEDK